MSLSQARYRQNPRSPIRKPQPKLKIELSDSDSYSSSSKTNTSSSIAFLNSKPKAEESESISHSMSMQDSKSMSKSDSDDESSGDNFHLTADLRPTIPPVDPIPKSNLRMLDRYRTATPRVMSRLQFPIFSERVVTYSLFRKSHYKNGIKRKYYQLTENGNVVAGASMPSSKLFEINNMNGLIAEIDVESSKGPFIMRLGNDKIMSVSGGPGRMVKCEFFDNDDSKPPYHLLISKARACMDTSKAFGSRRAIQSIKNCKLCDSDEKEIIAVRKIRKNVLEIDAKYNISFVSCMVVGLFMFSKP